MFILWHYIVENYTADSLTINIKVIVGYIVIYRLTDL